jgi:DNA-directed RNA polymerase specialized sigma24 family protein
LGSEDAVESVRVAVDAVYRTDSRRVLATLIRLLGDFDLAEEAMHDAFTAAVEQWPRDGIPANPRAWLVSTGRFKSISTMRKRARFDASLAEIAERLEAAARDSGGHDEESVDDDRLRLIFTCCHPALTPDAQIALTLREVRVSRPKRSPMPSLRLPRPSPSASSAPRRRFATRGFRIRCRRWRSRRTPRQRPARRLPGVQRGGTSLRQGSR